MSKHQDYIETHYVGSWPSSELMATWDGETILDKYTESQDAVEYHSNGTIIAWVAWQQVNSIIYHEIIRRLDASKHDKMSSSEDE